MNFIHYYLQFTFVVVILNISEFYINELFLFAIILLILEM